jgi:hypothetical protein
MARQDEKHVSKSVAILILLVRDSVDAPFQETEQGIEIFPRDDFYFGRGASWYLQYMLSWAKQVLTEQYFQFSGTNYL